jgi:hypothetical protein
MQRKAGEDRSAVDAAPAAYSTARKPLPAMLEGRWPIHFLASGFERPVQFPQD